MKLREIIKKTLEYIGIKDILMFTGIAATCKGIYMVYEPGMWIALGVFVIYLAWPKKAVE